MSKLFDTVNRHWSVDQYGCCRQFASREVYAHAVLESHPHIVRYYSAWTEDNHMFIQSEFCNGKAHS